MPEGPQLMEDPRRALDSRSPDTRNLDSRSPDTRNLDSRSPDRRNMVDQQVVQESRRQDQDNRYAQSKPREYRRVSFCLVEDGHVVQPNWW